VPPFLILCFDRGVEVMPTRYERAQPRHIERPDTRAVARPFISRSQGPVDPLVPVVLEQGRDPAGRLAPLARGAHPPPPFDRAALF